MEKYYFYESHLGGYYYSEELYDDDYLFCEACWDSDTLLNNEPITLDEFKEAFPDEYAEGEAD